MRLGIATTISPSGEMAMHEGVWFAPSEPGALNTLTRRAAWARSDGGSVNSRHVV